MTPWIFVQAVPGVFIDSPRPGFTARMQFPAPASARVGDQIVVLLAHSNSVVPAISWSPADEYDNASAFLGDASARYVHVYRRTVTDDEPELYIFDATGTVLTLAAMLVYRGIDRAALLGGSIDDFVAGQHVHCPKRTTVRPSDLFIGGAYIENLAGTVMTAEPGNEASTKRAETTFQIFSTDVARLMIFDRLQPAAGDASAAIVCGAATDGSSFSFVLPCSPIIGEREIYSPIVSGAIGLPVEGI